MARGGGDYQFDGPDGKTNLLGLFEGRRQLVVYRAFFEPGVIGWPDHACVGCSLMADQVAHIAHLNARDTTFAYASRAPQAEIKRLKQRMGWTMPWYTITDEWDANFGVDRRGKTRPRAIPRARHTTGGTGTTTTTIPSRRRGRCVPRPPAQPTPPRDWENRDEATAS